MSNYVIPPRSRPADYEKYARAQDEIIALQIANDANIANARKLVKLGTPLQLTKQEEMSPAELLADIGQQEANARANLEKLGFRPQESSDIIAAIRRDPSIDFSQLNANFPSIEADIKKRFNVKLLTATFFIEYFKKYSDDLAGATGMKVFAPNNSENANALINNVAEIRRLLPDPNVIAFLEDAARKGGLRDVAILKKLNVLQNALPTAQQLDNLSRLDPVTQQQMINDILLQTQNIPSAAQFSVLMQLVKENNISTTDLMRELKNIASSVPSGMTTLITPTKMTATTATATPITMTVAPDLDDPSISLKSIKTYLISQGLDQQIKNANGNPVSIDNLVKKPTLVPNKIMWEDTNIRDLLNQPLQKMGSGFRFKTSKMSSIEPKIKLKVGRGIAVKQMPTYREFGKYAIHIPQLENNDILNIKYVSLGPVPKFKPTAVSDIFRDFLLDVLETGKPNIRVYSQISPEERKLFEELSIGAGIWKGFGLQRTTVSEDEQENTRFELLRGEFLAGNNHPKMIQELRKLIIKFMSDGRIKKHDGLMLLQQLN